MSENAARVALERTAGKSREREWGSNGGLFFVGSVEGIALSTY